MAEFTEDQLEFAQLATDMYVDFTFGIEPDEDGASPLLFDEIDAVEIWMRETFNVTGTVIEQLSDRTLHEFRVISDLLPDPTSPCEVVYRWPATVMMVIAGTPRFAAHFATLFAQQFRPKGRLFVVQAGVGYNWFDPSAGDIEKIAALTVHDEAVMRTVEDGQSQ